MFTIDNWMVGWTPATGPWSEIGDAQPAEIEIGLWPDTTRRSGRCVFTEGCFMLVCRDHPLNRTIMLLFVDCYTITVCDGIDPQRSHQEFLNIEGGCQPISKVPMSVHDAYDALSHIPRIARTRARYVDIETPVIWVMPHFVPFEKRPSSRCDVTVEAVASLNADASELFQQIDGATNTCGRREGIHVRPR